MCVFSLFQIKHHFYKYHIFGIGAYQCRVHLLSRSANSVKFWKITKMSKMVLLLSNHWQQGFEKYTNINKRKILKLLILLNIVGSFWHIELEKLISSRHFRAVEVFHVAKIKSHEWCSTQHSSFQGRFLLPKNQNYNSPELMAICFYGKL